MIASAAFPSEWEAIFVNDASTDGSREALCRLAQEHARIRVAHLQSRAGKSAALAAGFSRARGDVIAIMDADLQNDPTDIPRMLALLEAEKLDAVFGIRVRRRDHFLRVVSSKIANIVRRQILGDGASDSGCGLQIFRADALQRIKMFDNMHRFMPALFHIEGFRVAEIPVNHRPRLLGKAKYGIRNRLFAGMADVLAVRWMNKRKLRYVIEEDET